MQIIIFEDGGVQRLAPLVHLKPVFMLCTGASSLLERFVRHVGVSGELKSYVRNYLRPWYRRELKLFDPADERDDDILLVNGRLLADREAARVLVASPPEPGTSLLQEGDLVAARLTAMTATDREAVFRDVVDIRELMSRTTHCEVSGLTLLHYPWDLVRYHPQQMARQAPDVFQEGVDGTVGRGACLVDRERICVGKGAVVKPGAVLDPGDGYIVIGPGAVVEHQAVLTGSVVVAEGARVRPAARIGGNVYIGRGSKVGGEVEDSVMEPFCNKQHDGFLGHSYISSWCNLGAGTTTSDLRNDYRPVRVRHEGGVQETGMQFLGLLMGEHSKASIGSMFNTGTIAGTSSNIFGTGFPPKSVPSFSWGGAADGFVPYDIDRAVETARLVMARRNVDMNRDYETMFRYVAARAQGGSVLL